MNSSFDTFFLFYFGVAHEDEEELSNEFIYFRMIDMEKNAKDFLLFSGLLQKSFKCSFDCSL